MLLKVFLDQFGGLGDEFLAHFTAPFLLEEGRLQLEEGGGDARQVFYLESEGGKPLVVTRSEGRGEIVIADKNVSGRHAELRPPGAGLEWTVSDLGSTNGTFLNGRQLAAGEPAALRDEAVVAFGPVSSFVFLLPHTFLALVRQKLKKASGSGSDVAKLDESATLHVSAAELKDVLEAAPVPATPRPAPAATKSAQPAKPAKDGGLVLHCEPFEPVPLVVGQKVVIGRSDLHADFVLPHPLVSRRHAEFDVRPEGVFVRDLRSANGTHIGKHTIGTEPVEVPPGLAVRIGDFKLVIKGKRTEPEFGGKTMVAAPPKPERKLLRGDFQKMPLGDLLVGIEEKTKSGSIQIEGAQVRGRIAFHAGAPVSADASGGLSGVDAIRALLKVEATAKFVLDPSPRNFGARRINRTFSELVLEDFLG